MQGTPRVTPMPLQYLLRQRHIFSLLLLIAAAAVARISILQLDFNSLLQSFLVDDAFYDFKVAANFMATQRITYDGEGLSNGFHPLWMLVITPFHTDGNNGLEFVTRVLWIMEIIQILSAIALYLLLTRLGAGWWISFAGAAILGLHSTMLDFQSCGLETALNTLVLLLLLHAFLLLYATPSSRLLHYFYFGLISALAFLARTDNAIALVVLFGALLPGTLRQKRFAALCAAGAATLLVASPWLIWSQINFGSIVQTSGKVDSIFLKDGDANWQFMLYALVQSPLRLFHFSRDMAKLFFYPGGHFSEVAAVMLAFWCASLAFLLRPRQDNRMLRAVAWFSLAVFLVYCYHAGFRNFVRPWYCIAAALALCLGYLGALTLLSQQTGTRIPVFAAGIMAAWLGSVLWLHSPTKLPGTTERLSTHIIVSDWINANLPADAVIGSMNSGALSYLAQRKVINLDGVMDIRSLQAHWQRRLPQYIHERGIDYLVDNRGSLRAFCEDNALHTCEPVFQFGPPKNPGLVVKITDKP